MFKNMNNERRLSDGQSSSKPPGSEVTTVGLDSQESSWLGLLSRPALSLIRKFRLGGAAPMELRSHFISEEREFLRRLNDVMPLTQPASAHLSYLRCPQDGAPGSALSGGTAASLQDVGIRDIEDIEQQTRLGYFSFVRTVLNQVISQELESKAWVSVIPPARSGSAGKGGSWWGGFPCGEERLQTEMSRPERDTGMDQLCPQTEVKTNAGAAAHTATMLEPMLEENTGPHLHKEEPANNGGHHTVQNMAESMVDQLNCSKRQNPSSEQDNGYSSLEELPHRALLSQMKSPHEKPHQQDPYIPEMEVEPLEEQQTASEEDHSGGVTVLSAPQCENKAIAFIMGCACSDDSSQSECSDDDDDGFDSEGSSDLSDSSDEEEEASDSDSEPDSELGRLWTSLCQSGDPYNPRNFTALLHTNSHPRQTSPTSMSASTPQSSPVSPSPFTFLTPPSSQDVWDDSTSASEIDEAESLRLLSSFSCSSDPYSPFNFQAPLRTQGPIGPPSKALIKNNPAPLLPPPAPHHNPASPPEYRKEEAEERLDSGFSEAPTSTRVQSCRSVKKVQFCDDVEEFFTSCGDEERRGPWEELARDRCRFLRRCQEVEQIIAYCLQPQHRRQVFQRFAIL